MVTTNLILVETANLFKLWKLHHLSIHAIASTFAAHQAGAIVFLSVDEELLLRGYEYLKSRPDKDWGLTDCISFVVMQDRGITSAFTADRHFEQAGFERLLKA